MKFFPTVLEQSHVLQTLNNDDKVSPLCNTKKIALQTFTDKDSS